MIFGTYDMPKFAMKNRKEVESSALAGCFYCCATYEPKEVQNYTDEGQTCLCPRCGVDAVVGDMGLPGELTDGKLQKAKFYWFGKK